MNTSSKANCRILNLKRVNAICGKMLAVEGKLIRNEYRPAFVVLVGAWKGRFFRVIYTGSYSYLISFKKVVTVFVLEFLMLRKTCPISHFYHSNTLIKNL
jgi:hypothetical protein